MSCVPGVSVNATTQAWYSPSPSTTMPLGRIAVRSGNIVLASTGAVPTMWNKPGGLSLGACVDGAADAGGALAPVEAPGPGVAAGD